MSVNGAFFCNLVGICMLGGSLDVGKGAWKQFIGFKNDWIKISPLLWKSDTAVRLYHLQSELDSQFAVSAEVRAVEIHFGIPFNVTTDAGDTPFLGGIRVFQNLHEADGKFSSRGTDCIEVMIFDPLEKFRRGHLCETYSMKQHGEFKGKGVVLQSLKIAGKAWTEA